MMGCFHLPQCPGSHCRTQCSQLFWKYPMNYVNTFDRMGDITWVIVLKFSCWGRHQRSMFCPAASQLFRASSLTARICLPLALPPSFPPSCHLYISSPASSSKRPPVVPDSFTLLSWVIPGRKIVPSHFKITKTLFLSLTLLPFHLAFPCER